MEAHQTAECIMLESVLKWMLCTVYRRIRETFSAVDTSGSGTLNCHDVTLHYLLLLLLLLLLLHPSNGLFSRTTRVSRHQKGKPIWILLEQEMMGWQWHQLDHMQIICTSLQIDNHTSTSPLSFCRLDALPAAQPTASKHCII